MRLPLLLAAVALAGCTHFSSARPVRTSYVEYPPRAGDAPLDVYDAARPAPAELKEFAVYRYRFDADDVRGHDRFRSQAKQFARDSGAEALSYEVVPDGHRVVLIAHLLHR